MSNRRRPYLFYDVAISICPECFRRVDAKIVFEDGKVLMLKHCPRHGASRVLVADDIEYYRRSREVFVKVPEQPERCNTPTHFGCPYDCGLCPDHEQHSCLTLVELTDHCNLRCPMCYSGSGPDRPHYRTLAEIEAMLDATVRNEGHPDVVQLSGGEPTLHPQFFEILDLARARPIRHLMLNTNGIRIAEDAAFVERLSHYREGFELYLQFDSLRPEPLRALRGADLRRVRSVALERLNAAGLSTTLVVTLLKGQNDGEIGNLIRFALTQPCVRGVTFQPVQHAGRSEGFDPGRDRLTLTEVRRAIIDQSGIFSAEDVVPVPCHPDSIAMAYALKIDGKVQPLTRFVPPELLVEAGGNTIVYESDPGLRARIFSLFSTGHSPASGSHALRELLCCLPRVKVPETITYRNVFRVIVMAFIDAHSFDLRAIKKTCVHIARPDGRLIPFDTFNLFYRDGLESTRLAPLRAAAEMAMGENDRCVPPEEAKP